MKKLWDKLGGAVAIIMTVLYAVIIANEIFGFIGNAYILKILSEGIAFGGLALVVIVTFEMTTKWPFLFKLVIFATWVLIMVYLFSPTFFGLIK